MVSRLALLPRFALVLAAFALATTTATVTFAASKQRPAPAAAPLAQQAELVVPDVRRQPYVFAKGALEESGFAWRVRGAVQGYAANTVAAQSPAPGVRVVDTGTPTISLTLARNARYAEKGTPENASPFAGTAVRVPGLAAVHTTAAVNAPAPKAKPGPAAKAKPAARPPAFAVPGAPREPLDEITLVARARALDRWIARHPTPTDANVRHWLYQHAWIVTGANFGWSQGETALRVLVAVDRRVEAAWGVGSRSRTVAEQALAVVRERSR